MSHGLAQVHVAPTEGEELEYSPPPPQSSGPPAALPAAWVCPRAASPQAESLRCAQEAAFCVKGGVQQYPAA